ncbi:MAG TPA: hypothetical protein VKA87_10825 [Nitrososphaeraceae archaeon]|jgi:hypothetical protein|nr:hypothetical protein [Nitrososphaeraceae archaeon]
MEITSKLNDFENRVYLDKISKSVRDLNSTATDTLLFVEQMVSLSALLSSFDRNLGNSFPAIDENAQDPTYFIAAYFDTKNIADALWVYRIVRSLTRYILLSDRFYETGNDRYALLAKQVHKSVNEFLRSECNAQHLIYSIDYSLEQFSAFWKFEQIVKRRILENYTFSYTELRHFNLSKSSDAPLVYAKVLDAKLPSFNENVALVLHYNQALLDIQDDWEDIEDDVQEDMPNIFVMAAVDTIPYNRIKKSRQDIIREVVLTATNSSEGPVSRLVNELHASSKSVSIPENFSFLKSLSDRYADTLRRKILSSSANS